MGRTAARSALLVVDMINPLDFPGADRLLRQALPMLPALARLKKRLKSRGVPVIYVNDNFFSPRRWKCCSASWAASG